MCGRPDRPGRSNNETAMRRKFQGPTARVGRPLQACALLCALLFGAGPVLGQSSPSKSQQTQTGIDEATREMRGDERLKTVPRHKRKDMVEFVAGNMLFVLLHEMAHVHVTEMGLPVLGREEDAADAFATLAMLNMRSDFSYNVLIQAAKGWFLSAERDERKGTMLAFYDEHGLDKQRAYQIVCLMVGSDPDRFKALADWVKMPDSRQESCQGDYSNASYSWSLVLKPHRRAADQPKIKIDTIYGEGKGKLDVSARSFRVIRLMEIVAERAAEEYVWRAPFTLEMQTCGRPDAHWDLFAHRLILCYEMAEEFVQLYSDDMANQQSSIRMSANDLIAGDMRGLPARRNLPGATVAAEARLTESRMTRAERGVEGSSVAQLEYFARALNTELSSFLRRRQRWAR
jgi:Putative metallopeptidase